MHDTFTLKRVCEKDSKIRPYFWDVFGADQGRCVPTDKRYPKCAIFNTDPIAEPGQHWVAVYWDSADRGEFFDSYAELPATLYPPWYCWNDYQQVLQALQQWSTDVCGDYCLYFLYKRCRGISFSDIVSYFKLGNLKYNDQAVMQRMHELFPSLLKKELHNDTPQQYCIVRQWHKAYITK